jgi:hypothetical protein
MAKLSDPMIKALRAIADAGPDGMDARGPSVAALQRRLMVKRTGPRKVTITPSGEAALRHAEEIERRARQAQERASRPIPATAFVEPSASRPVAAFPEYEDETEEPAADCSAQYVPSGRAPYSCDREAGHEGDHWGSNGTAVAVWDDRSPHAVPAASPVVLLTARVTARTPDATDAELLQLLALLDADVIVTRRLYQDWRLESETPLPLDPERVAAAAAEAVAQHLAHAAPVAHGRYRLRPEPIHLVGTDPAFTVCGVRTTGRQIGHRIRYTRDPDKATHDRCKLPKRVTD